MSMFSVVTLVAHAFLVLVVAVVGLFPILLPVCCLLQIVGIILISVAAAAKASSHFSSLSILGGIIASGVFLIAVAVLGVIGAVKHHQVILFFVSSPFRFGVCGLSAS